MANNDLGARLLPAAAGFAVGAVASYIFAQAQNNNISVTGTSITAQSHVDGHPHTVELPMVRRSTKNNPPLNIKQMTTKQTLDDVKDWSGKRVLMRVDYNVKVKNDKVIDDTRIQTTLDTLRYLVKQNVKSIALITHLGRPAPGDPKFDPKATTLEPVARHLQSLLGDDIPVKFISQTFGEEAVKQINASSKPTVYVMENLRHHPEETGVQLVNGKKQKVSFAQKQKFRQHVNQLGDIFVFEAFGAAHRPHSSIIGSEHPQRVAGLLLQREIKYFGGVLANPARPFCAIIGGAKVSDKILVLENMLNLVDEMIIGGGMAYTFKKVLDNVKIGSSLFDEPGSRQVEKIMRIAKEKGVKIHLPNDHVIADKFAADARTGVASDEDGIPDGWMGLDVGPQTRAHNSVVINRANTVIWNGPLGVFEMGAFSAGTLAAMFDVVQCTRRGGVTIIGGGDTGTASKQFYVGGKTVAEQVSHVSTGGGSSLVLMEGKMLPAIQFLSDKGNNNPPTPLTEQTEPADDGDD